MKINLFNQKIENFISDYLTSPCFHCKNRQSSLDPEGCWKQCSTTGYIGRGTRWLFGCECYKE